MDNPYKALASAPQEQKVSSTSGLIQLLLGTAFAFIAALIPTVVAPQFRSVFTGFGAELPIVTQLFIDYHLTLWALPILVIAVHFFYPSTKKRKLLSLLLGIFSLLVIIPLMLWALYLPVFQLGQAA